MQKVLIVVDYQKDFVIGELPVPEAEKIAKAIQAEIDNPKYNKIVYTMDTHTKDDYYSSEESKMFPDIHCEFNTEGWELYKIKPRNREINNILNEGVCENSTDFSVKDEFVFMKDKFSIWEGNSTYEKWFLETFEKDTEITIVGVALEVCVRFNAEGYQKFGYTNIKILESCVKGLNLPDFEEIVTGMKQKNISFV